MSDQRSHGKRITDAIEVIVCEAKSALKSALRRSRAESLGENLIETVQSVLSSRKRMVMVRLDQDSLKPVDDLVEAGVVNSRSASRGGTNWCAIESHPHRVPHRQSEAERRCR